MDMMTNAVTTGTPSEIDESVYDCYLGWQETLDPDGEPLALAGECQVAIGFEADALEFTFPISGDPATLDAQLDPALTRAGYVRISDINPYPQRDRAAGRCQVRLAPDGERAPRADDIPV